MTSSSMPEQEHGRSPTETVTMASDEPKPQLPGLGDPAAWRSAVSMVTGGAGEEEEVMGAEGRLGDDVVLVGTPCGQLLLAPTPLSSMKQLDEVSAPPFPENMPAAAQKQCVQCGAAETPQWRMQPMGQGALCNACRIRLRPAEALREPVDVHLPPPAISAEAPADAWISKAWMDFDAYLLNKVTSPRRKKSPSLAPAPAPEEKKQKRKRKPPLRHPRNSSPKQCRHCKSASTPQWRMGPTGPCTLCDGCGVRYRQGRLLQEYRPAASPNFKRSKHACKRREALQPRQKKHRGKEQQHQPPQPPRAGDGMEQHLPPPPAQAQHAGGTGDELPMGEPNTLDHQFLLDAFDGSPETRIVYGVGTGDLQMGDPSSLDQFLFGGPAAPLLIDDDGDGDSVD